MSLKLKPPKALMKNTSFSLNSHQCSKMAFSMLNNCLQLLIVGAGSAGAAVASRLSEIPCVTVLLLEAGKPPPRMNDIPVIARYYVNTDLDWQYFTAPQKHTAAGIIDRVKYANQYLIALREFKNLCVRI